MADLISFYSSKVELYRNKIEKARKNIFYTAAGRLISFILLVVFIYSAFSKANNVYLVYSILSLIAFLFLIKKSNALDDEKRLLENLLFINNNELQVLQGETNKFDNGDRFLSNESYFADLDVFGKASLFHLINRTSTEHGTTALAELLKQPIVVAEAITSYQQAIQAFAPQPHLHEQIIAKALINKEATANINPVQQWLEEPSVIVPNKWMSIARYLVPGINFIALAVYLERDNYFWLTLTVFISWIHIGAFAKYINRQHLLLGKKEEMLEQYASILKEFTKAEAGASTLLAQNIKVANEAHGQVKKLSGLTNLLDQRLNILVNFFLNSFLLYDIQCMVALEKWKLLNKEHLPKWIECVATIECVTSLAKFAFNHPTFCYPTLKDELIIEGEELSHPLIAENERVANSISIGRTSKLLLITGSNMSGKTTFLRTIGSNILLAQCGAPVCAKTFSFSPVHIYTSIRISDSLQEHTSYFMAELKRLREIKESIASVKPSLVLIDEILRGTNSDDKYHGSAEFVKKLIQYNCLTLFATHDLKLSELENDYKGSIENYCFESIIEKDELTFDYRILKGVAQNKNASFLMKKMKII